MSMKKKVIAIMIIAIVAAGITGCSEITSGENLYESIKGEKQISGKLECVDGNGICSEWVDTETGVHYFYTNLGGLEQRVNADGSPYVEGE